MTELELWRAMAILTILNIGLTFVMIGALIRLTARIRRCEFHISYRSAGFRDDRIDFRTSTREHN